MHSDACKHHACQRPLKVRVAATGEILELLHWSVGLSGSGFTATFLNGRQEHDAVVRDTMVLEPCECGESSPAERWPNDASMFDKIHPGARHPEQGDDEVFLANFRLDDMASVGWTTKRLGLNAYDVSGNRIKGMQPLFIKAQEAIRAGFEIANGRLGAKGTSAFA